MKMNNKEMQLEWYKILYQGWVEFRDMGWCHYKFKIMFHPESKGNGSDDYALVLNSAIDNNINKMIVVSKDGVKHLNFQKLKVRTVINQRIKRASNYINSLTPKELTQEIFISVMMKCKYNRLCSGQAYSRDEINERAAEKYKSSVLFVKSRGLTNNDRATAK